jgi:hypothetical protein
MLATVFSFTSKVLHHLSLVFCVQKYEVIFFVAISSASFSDTFHNLNASNKLSAHCSHLKIVILWTHFGDQ